MPHCERLIRFAPGVAAIGHVNHIDGRHHLEQLTG